MSGMFDPDGRTTARHILLTHRFLQAHPMGLIPIGIFPIGIFGEQPWTHANFSRWFTACLHAKINRADPRQTWRRMDWQYQSDLANDARQINDFMGKCVRHTGCSGILRTKEMRAKYPYINTQREDYP